MIPYNEIKPKTYIELDGTPFEVLSSHVFRKQQRKPVNSTKLRNLITGKVVEKSFHQSDKVEEAELETKEAIYLYSNKNEYWFSDKENAKDRFSLNEDLIKENKGYLREKDIVEVVSFRNEIIGINLPIKVDLRVTEAPPDVRGNTAQGGLKQVTLETGLVINVPMFVKTGDIIRVNTETGEYVERV